MKVAARRAALPADYGLDDDSPLLSWDEVAGRVRDSRHYWLATVTPDGSPHVRPVDGLWVEGRLYFGGAPDVKWVRNLKANQAATVHLDDPERVVVMDGVVSTTTPDEALAEALLAESDRKYEASQHLDDYLGTALAAFAPTTALAWNVLYEDATRFDFTP